MSYQQILLYIVLPTVAFFVLGGLLVLLIRFIKEKKDQKSFYDALGDFFVLSLFRIFQFITLPFQIVKAIFFVFDDKKEKRRRFSLTRTIFAFASLFMLFRVLTGGVAVDSINAGPEIKISKKRKRGYISAKKVQAKQVNMTELLLFLIFAGLYYFRRDLNKGDQGGFLQTLVKIIGEAYAIKISGGKSVELIKPEEPKKPEEVKKQEEQVTKELSQKPPEAPPHEK